MSEPKLTINELIAALQTKADISDEKAKDFINRYFSIIAEELKNNGSINVYKFGTFKKSFRKQRTGRNPRTGEEIEVPAKYNVTFSPNPTIAEKINKPYAKLKAVVIKENEAKKKVVAEKKIEPIAKEEESVAKESVVEETADNDVSMQELALLTGQKVMDTENPVLDLDDVFGAEVEAEIKEIQEQAIDISQELSAENDGFENVTQENATQENTMQENATQENGQTESETQNVASPAKSDDSSQVVRVIVSAEQPQTPMQAADSTVTTIRQPGVREQVIERQVIKEQIIEQRVTKQYDAEEHNKMANTNTDEQVDVSAIARCWFVAGIAVVCTIIIIGLLIYVLIGSHRDKVAERNAAITRIEKQIADVAEMRALKPNKYAEMASSEYSDMRLWPYIYGANRLRYSDPDYEIKIRETLMPPRPDRTLDRTTIEQSAIDAYRMYLNEYSDRPNSARGKEKRLRAVRVLADTEQILPGFISRYELSFDLEDIQLARRYLN